jgi:tRNA pseudouridine(38-40) synthase
VRTVEGELEKTLYKLGFINDFNYGDLKKIGFSRATRTDKGVHALLNVFSGKLLMPGKPKEMSSGFDEEKQLEDLREVLNKELPQDIKIFCLTPISQRFDAKNCTSHRVYSYFLPTFTLVPIQDIYLATPPKVEAPDQT